MKHKENHIKNPALMSILLTTPILSSLLILYISYGFLEKTLLLDKFTLFSISLINGYIVFRYLWTFTTMILYINTINPTLDKDDILGCMPMRSIYYCININCFLIIFKLLCIPLILRIISSFIISILLSFLIYFILIAILSQIYYNYISCKD